MKSISFMSATFVSRTFFLFLAVAIAIGFIPATSLADDGKAPPAAFRDKIFDIQFINNKTAFAVGYPGILMRTDDRGLTWTRQDLGTSEAFFSLDFVDEKNGWIAGRTGVVFATTDGGQNWKQQETQTTEALFDVDFLDAKTGVVVGNFGTVLRTDNGGATWNPLTIQIMQDVSLNAVSIVDGLTIYAAGDYPIWLPREVEEITDEDISNLWKTTDGGETWTLVRTGVEKALYSVHMFDAENGFVTGNGGTILSTTDGGENWIQIQTPHDNLLMDLTKVGDTVYVVGSEGVVLRVKDGKAQQLPTNIYTWLCGIAFADKDNGVVVGGRGAILCTSDGGNTWTKHPIK